MMKTIKSTTELLSRLNQVLIKRRLLKLSAGLLLTLGASLALGVLLSALANLFILPVSLKVSLLVIGLGGLLSLLLKSSLLPLREGTIEDIAVDLEERNVKLKGRLIAAVQFATSKAYPGYSADLLELTRLQALEEAGEINQNEVLRFYPLWRTGRYLVGAVALAMLLLLTLPGFFSYSYEVYSNPTTEIAPPLGYKLAANPGSVEWVKYRDLTIGGSVFGFRLPESAKLHYRLVDGRWQTTEIDLNRLPHQVATEGDSVSFGLSLRQVNRSLDYYIEAGRLKSQTFRIDVVDRPRVAGIELNLFYPKYTGRSPMTIDENNGSFSALIGTRVNFTIETNLPVQTAEALFSDSSRVPLTIDGNLAKMSLVIDQSRTYQFALIDHLGEKNPDPIEYHITAIEDEYPTIDVLLPGFNVNLNDDLALPIKLHISDDYGFSSLVMKYTLISQGQTGDETVAVLHYDEEIINDGDIEFTWDLGQFNIFPGDYVMYSFEIADNDLISGPKVSVSRQYIARLPSLEEIIAQTENESYQRVRETQQLVKMGQEMAKRLTEAARKIESQNQQRPSENWQQERELSSILNKNAEMLKQVDKMANEMNQSLEKMRDNSLMSRQLMERLAEVQKLFEEVATPEMREAQRKLAEAMKNMDPEQMRQALEDFQMTQEELLERLKRTLALLKKLQVEQKMEAMVRQAEQLMERQKEMNDRTEATDQNALAPLSPQEQKNKDALESLKEQVAELDSLAREADMGQSEETRKFAEAIKKTDAQKNMQQMAGDLKSQKKDSAMKEGKTSLAKLSEMLDQMQTQLANLQEGDDDAMMAALQRSLQDANYLSQNQEEALKRVGKLNPQSFVSRQLALNQQDLQSACDGLKANITELGQQSPYVAAELTQLLNQATTAMLTAVEQLDSKQPRTAESYQREAMTKLNKVSLRLMESMEEQQECNNPKPDNAMAKMNSMCNKQKKLNKQTQSQCNNPTPSPNGKPSSMAGAERLAGEQAAIRKSLEELQGEFGNSRQILGRLDAIAREMKKVEEDMANGEVGEETMQRQLQIYSRMLQASRSLQRKDYTDQRQAKSAQTQQYWSPPELSPELLDQAGSLEERLQRYLGDDYPPQYEDQIKAYFRALLKLQYQVQDNN